MTGNILYPFNIRWNLLVTFIYWTFEKANINVVYPTMTVQRQFAVISPISTVKHIYSILIWYYNILLNTVNPSLIACTTVVLNCIMTDNRSVNESKRYNNFFTERGSLNILTLFTTFIVQLACFAIFWLKRSSCFINYLNYLEET